MREDGRAWKAQVLRGQRAARLHALRLRRRRRVGRVAIIGVLLAVLGSTTVAGALWPDHGMQALWHAFVRNEHARFHQAPASTSTPSSASSTTPSPDTAAREQAPTVATLHASTTTATDTVPPTTSAPAAVASSKCDRFVAAGESISNAVAAARDGDVVCVHGGVYHEAVAIDRANVTIANVDGETPIVDGTGMPLGPHDALWNMTAAADHVTVRGFVIRNSPGRGLVNDGSHNSIVGNHITNTFNAGLLTTNWSGAATDNEYAFNEIDHAVQSNDCHAVTDPCARSGGWESAIGQFDGGAAAHGGNRYIANDVHDNNGEGATASDGDQFSDNTFHDNFSVNLYLDAVQRVTAEDNFVYETATSYVPIGANGNESYRLLANGIALADEQVARSADNVVRGNLIVNTRDGIQFWNTGVAGTGLIRDTIEHNTIVNTWDAGIAVDRGAHAHTVVRDNIAVPRQGVPTRGLPAPGISLDGNTFTTRGAPDDPKLPGEGTFSVNPADYVTA